MTPHAVYSYHDAEGKLVYQVLRHPGPEKSFSQRRPRDASRDEADPNPWVSDLEGVRRVLYHLPQLLAADPAHPVFLCEGEKDVHTLEALGLVATSNSGGAPGWEEQLVGWLRDRDVIITEDNDDRGRKGARTRAESLVGIAHSIRVVRFAELPEHGDVSDFLDAHPMEELWERVAAVVPVGEEVRVRLVSLSEVQVEPVSFLWEPYLPRGKLTMLEGDPGVMKSFLSLWLAAGLSKGQLPAGGGKPSPLEEPERTLLLVGEDGIADTVRPRLEAMGADLDQITALTAILDEDDAEHPLMLDAEGLLRLEEAIERVRPGLVVIDPIVAYLGAKVDMHRANEVRAMLAPLYLIAQKYGCAIVTIRHLNKAGGIHAAYRGQGSIDFFAAVRSVLLVGTDPDDPGCSIMVQSKANLARKGPSHRFRITDNVFGWDGITDHVAEDLLQNERQESGGRLEEAMAFVREKLSDGPRQVKEIIEEWQAMGNSPITLTRARKKLGVQPIKRPTCWMIQLPDEEQGDQGDQVDQGDRMTTLPVGASRATAKAGHQGGQSDEGDQGNQMIALIALDDPHDPDERATADPEGDPSSLKPPLRHYLIPNLRAGQ